AKSHHPPPHDNEYLVWHDQFKTIMASNGATVGMAAGDITATTPDNTTMHTRIAAVNSTAATAAQAVVDKNTDRAATERRARALVKRIKAHPAYTAALGQLFGIIGAEDTTDLTTSKPTLSGTDQTGGSVQIGWDKSISDGVNIYSKRGAEADFTLLHRDNDSPYTDDRPLLVAGKPELREYKAVRILADAEI